MTLLKVEHNRRRGAGGREEWREKGGERNTVTAKNQA